MLIPHYSVESRPSQILPLILPQQERSRWRNTLSAAALPRGRPRDAGLGVPEWPQPWGRARLRGGDFSRASWSKRTCGTGQSRCHCSGGSRPPSHWGWGPLVPPHQPRMVLWLGLHLLAPLQIHNGSKGWSWVSTAAALEGAPSLQPS